MTSAHGTPPGDPVARGTAPRDPVPRGTVSGEDSPRIRPVTGAAGMIGEVGKALTAIEPGKTGRVATHGETWKAIAEEPIAQGDLVLVTRVDGLTLTVRKQRPDE